MPRHIEDAIDSLARHGWPRAQVEQAMQDVGVPSDPDDLISPDTLDEVIDRLWEMEEA